MTWRRVAARGLDRAAAGGDQMKDADVAQMRHRHAFVVTLGRDHAEWRGEAAAQENRTGEADGPQHVRQDIGLRRGGARPGVSANEGGVSVIVDGP